MENDVELLNVEQCASFLGKSIPTIRKYIKKNEIPYSKKVGSIYFIKSELIDWIRNDER